ncbi:hypothetical protein BDF14DRAFT_1064785 [Spinellus fusiger]|nr:hypothetical protein BDF14DRAFT_1064785 [Spinellus fusiger]
MASRRWYEHSLIALAVIVFFYNKNKVFFFVQFQSTPIHSLVTCVCCGVVFVVVAAAVAVVAILFSFIMDGPTIRDYIEARKKKGMSWEDYRKLKEEKEGPGVSDAAMVKYRRQLDNEREGKLLAGRKRARESDKDQDKDKDKDRKRKKKKKHSRKHHDSKSESSHNKQHISSPS